LINGGTKSCGCHRNVFRIIDLTGRRFGKLLVVQKGGVNDSHSVLWKCKCDCGNDKTASSIVLLQGYTKSCGCLRKETTNPGNKTHGFSKKNGKRSKLYRVWANMKDRCFNTNSCNYSNYGARSISMDNDWVNSYETFHNWAMITGYMEGLSIDRIDNDGNYEPYNCKWSTIKEQSMNRRTNHVVEYENSKYTIGELSEKFNINLSTLSSRINRGYSVEQAISKETNKGIKLKLK
jgi:hypothetical protein